MLHDAQQTRLATATNKASKSAQSQVSSDSARLMPVERQTFSYVEPTEPISRIFSEHSGLPVSQIRSIRQAPSTVVTEQYLQARAGSSPVFMQNVSSLRSERISNLYADAPRFKSQVDILA
jgi:hypothetical protein